MMETILGEGGWLSEHLPNFKTRPIQVELATLIDKALYEKKHLLGEWPTGTGKSMAYGIPAAIYALDKECTVVVVTANITLQEQLYQKDFPLIADLLEGNLFKEDGEPCPRLNYSLAKGMANYLCLDKLAELEASANPPLWLHEISDWAAETESGDKSELDKEYPHDVWGAVSSNSDECTKGKCGFFKKCYAFAARRSTGPGIVITNYHMLFTDIVVRAASKGKSRILPPYKAIVMDEAHEAADIAMSFSGFELGEGKFRWMSRFIAKADHPQTKRVARMINAAAERFFKALKKVNPDSILREPLGFDEGILAALDDAASTLGGYIADNKGAVSTENGKRIIARLELMLMTLGKRHRELKEVCFGREDDEGKVRLPTGKVYYVEKTHKGERRLCCKVVEVQGFFRSNVFSKATTICVSATMTAGTPKPDGSGDFKFISKQLGLVRGEFIEKAVDSPFNPEHVLLVVPNSVPQPKKQKEHTEEVGRVVEQVVKDLGGRTMALFTSYRALNSVSRYLHGRLGGVRILVQGELPKSKIISEMKRDPESLILATASFWQGVDIPGQNLSCVIIDKFPFAPPSDPVVQYMEEKLEMEGGSSFMDYSIPKAIITLKQGVGRLIRRETDFGAIVLCDNRIETTGYGKRFVRAFPRGHFRSSTGDLADVKFFLEGAING